MFVMPCMFLMSSKWEMCIEHSRPESRPLMQLFQLMLPSHRGSKIRVLDAVIESKLALKLHDQIVVSGSGHPRRSQAT